MAQRKRGTGKNKKTKQAPIGYPQIESGPPSLDPPSNVSLPSASNEQGTVAKHGNSSSTRSPRTSASILQTPDTVAISGGQFNSTLGHHVTINLNQSSSERSAGEQSSKVTLASLPTTPPRKSSPSNTGVGDSPTFSETTGSTGISISVESNPRGQLDVSPQKSNEIYERHLWLKDRGFPLWIPEPNKRLPLVYRKKGIEIGDVGIITPSGGFSFLFNICVPSDSPINPRLLPEGFLPISPPLDALDIIEFDEFKPGSYLASSSIENSQSGSDARGLVFETSASEGAILTMPEGAVAYDLENVPAFRHYVAENVEKWYKFVNGVRGREAKNGDIRLVIGCDKTTSWGMAALANVTQQKVNQLKFKANEDNSVKSTRPLYSWDYSGMAEVKVGPDIKEINALRRSDPLDVNPPSDEEFSNQCLFIRTLNATLSDEQWKVLNDSLGSTNDLDSNSSSRATGFPEIPPRSHRSTYTNTSFNASQSPGHSNLGSQGSLTRPVQGFQLEEGTDGPTLPSRLPHPNMENDVSEGRGAISTTPDAIVYHPSDGLNKLLLKKFPACKMVVTEDHHWYSVVKEGDDILPGPERLLDRVLSSNDIQVENGILFLERKTEIPVIAENAADVSERRKIKDNVNAPKPRPAGSSTATYGNKITPRPQEPNSRKMKLKSPAAALAGVVESRTTAPRRNTKPPQSVIVPRNTEEGDDEGNNSSSCGSSDGLESEPLWDNSVTSEGGFTDYLTDISEAELQRQAEARAALIAQNQAEELEFKLARQQIGNVVLQPPKAWNPTSNTATRKSSSPVNIRK